MFHYDCAICSYEELISTIFAMRKPYESMRIKKLRMFPLLILKIRFQMKYEILEFKCFTEKNEWKYMHLCSPSHTFLHMNMSEIETKRSKTKYGLVLLLDVFSGEGFKLRKKLVYTTRINSQ